MTDHLQGVYLETGWKKWEMFEDVDSSFSFQNLEGWLVNNLEKWRIWDTTVHSLKDIFKRGGGGRGEGEMCNT